MYVFPSFNNINTFSYHFLVNEFAGNVLPQYDKNTKLSERIPLGTVESPVITMNLQLKQRRYYENIVTRK